MIDGYAETKQVEDSAITREFISRITEEWSRIDQDATGRISYHEFRHFCPVFMRIFEQKESSKDIDPFLGTK